jgi:hypothetical protein
LPLAVLTGKTPTFRSEREEDENEENKDEEHGDHDGDHG